MRGQIRAIERVKAIRTLITRHRPSWTSGLPFSTIYVASSAALLAPTFFAEWIVPAGMKRTSPALSVTGGFPSSRYSNTPSRT